MSRLRVVFMGTPEFSLPALRAINAAHEIIAVYTQPDRPVGRGLELKPTPVKALALALGLPVSQPLKLTLPGEFEKIQMLAPDVMVVVAYGQILKKNVLELPRLGCVNIHSSLLPRWRGAAPIHHALLAGDRETGITTMRMVEKLDAGAMYLQERVTIGAAEKITQLHDRLSEIGGELILRTLAGLDAGTLPGHAQNEAEVTYASKLTKEMETLDPKREAAALDRQIRALNPWPGTSVHLDFSGKPERIKIRDASLQSRISVPMGQLVEHAGMLLLGCAGGSLEIRRVQLDGKKEMDVSAFLNGLRGRGLSLPISVVQE